MDCLRAIKLPASKLHTICKQGYRSCSCSCSCSSLGVSAGLIIFLSQLTLHRAPQISMRARGSLPRGDTSRGGLQGGTSRGSPQRGGTFRGRGQSDGNNLHGKRARAPNRVIIVPVEFQRQTKDSERSRLITAWKTETGCEVVPRGSDRFVITRFELFGISDKLDKATQKIEEWIRYSVTKTPETTGWAKLSAHIPKDWYEMPQCQVAMS
jgi:hypothetical protein